MSKTFTDAIGTPVNDTLFDQLTTMTKAHAYDILVEQVKELKEENRNMARLLKECIECDFTSGTHVSCLVANAKMILKDRKPYNL